MVSLDPVALDGTKVKALGQSVPLGFELTAQHQQPVLRQQALIARFHSLHVRRSGRSRRSISATSMERKVDSSSRNESSSGLQNGEAAAERMAARCQLRRRPSTSLSSDTAPPSVGAPGPRSCPGHLQVVQTGEQDRRWTHPWRADDCCSPADGPPHGRRGESQRWCCSPARRCFYSVLRRSVSHRWLLPWFDGLRFAPPAGQGNRRLHALPRGAGRSCVDDLACRRRAPDQQLDSWQLQPPTQDKIQLDQGLGLKLPHHRP